MNFYLGCAVWSYKAWVGNLYPPKSRPQDFLHLYSRRFTTVEGNTTFYAVPPTTTVHKWYNQTPPGFKFCPKFPRTVTHQGLLQPQITAAKNFLSRMSALGDRLGTLFIQLSPSYSPEQFSDLQHFLIACSESNYSLALEVRHLGWFEPDTGDRLNEMLTALNIARVLLDTRPIYNAPDDPQRHSTRRKPQVPLQPTVTGNTAFVRFISHPEREYNESYLRSWIPQIETWLRQKKQIYFFVHCPLEERSPNTACYFQSLLEQEGVPVPTLPWNNLDPIPTQLNLF